MASNEDYLGRSFESSHRQGKSWSLAAPRLAQRSLFQLVESIPRCYSYFPGFDNASSVFLSSLRYRIEYTRQNSGSQRNDELSYEQRRPHGLWGKSVRDRVVCGCFGEPNNAVTPFLCFQNNRKSYLSCFCVLCCILFSLLPSVGPCQPKSPTTDRQCQAGRHQKGAGSQDPGSDLA